MSELLGNVVSWNMRNFRVKFSDLVGYLTAAGLDPKLARSLSPRNAFGRACRRLSESRVIRKVEEDEDVITFQFTREGKGTDKLFEYWMESLVRLNKKTGVIQADLDVLRDRAQKELDSAMGERSGSDISELVLGIFKAMGDVWQIQGNVWFVPEKNLGTVEQVQNFLDYLGQKISRFAVPKGNKESETSVRDVIVRGLQKFIEEHKKAIEGMGDTTRGSTLERVVEKIKETKFKVEAYRELLSSSREALETSLNECNQMLRSKISAMAEGVPA